MCVCVCVCVCLSVCVSKHRLMEARALLGLGQEAHTQQALAILKKVATTHTCTYIFTYIMLYVHTTDMCAWLFTHSA